MSLVDDCRALDRRVFSLALARLVVTAGYSMVMPFLAMHLAVDRKVPVVIVGSILFIAGSLGAVAQWLAGELADRVGRRPLLLGAMWLRALNLGAMGFAVASTAPLSLIVPVIGLLTVANAVLRGFFDPVAGALVADLTTPSQRVAAFSIQRVGVNIGWAAGPAAAAFAAGASYASLFFASVPLTVISAVALSRMKDLPAPAGERRAFTLTELLAFTRDRQLLRFLVTTISFFVLQVQLYQTTSIYAAQVLGLGRREVGTVYTLNGVIVAFLQLPAIYAIKRLSPSRAIVMGSIGYGLAYASVGLVRDAFGLYAAIVAVTLAEIVSSPAQQTAITNLAPPGRVGAYMGLFGLCQAVGQSSGPLVGTTLLAVLPPRAAWFALALFGIGAALGYRGVVFPSQNPGKPLASARQA